MPLREAIFQDKPDVFHFTNDLPTIYITAGKQGSHVINEAVKEILPQLLESYNVIHQCGSHSQYDDFSELQKMEKELPAELQKRYVLRDYVYQDEVGCAFSRANIVISRAGAHTIYEIIALAKPAVLIPIPWVSHNEQLKNALVITEKEAGVLLEQKDLSGANLLSSVQTIQNDYQQYTDNAAQNKELVRFNATELMMEEIRKMIKETDN